MSLTSVPYKVMVMYQDGHNMGSIDENWFGFRKTRGSSEQLLFVYNNLKKVNTFTVFR